ncbi:MAG: cadherin domain-containing protein [Roseibium sp.]
MADSDTNVQNGKPQDGSAAEAAAKNTTGSSANMARAEAQAGDPYRTADDNDYALSIEPEDTGEATVANLFQAVPLEYEGSDARQDGGEGLNGNGSRDGGANSGVPGNGLENGLNGNVPLPDGEIDVVETADGGPNDGGGLGDGDVPGARGLDPTLSQFDLGGPGVRAASNQIGDGIGGPGGGDPEDDGLGVPSGGGDPEDDGIGVPDGGDEPEDDGTGDPGDDDDIPDDDEPEGVGIGPVTDSDGIDNFVQENADAGTVVGITAFASDPDIGDEVGYSIADSRFEIDPVTGVITVADGAVIDREADEFIDIEVTATSSDGSSSTGTFRVEIGDENEDDVTDIEDIDLTDNAVAENGDGGEYVGIKAFAEDPDATDTVTYSTDDPRFDIDPDTGVLTVKDGVSFDFEATPTTDVDITATSTDGSSSTGTFTVNILDVNEAPDLDFDADLGPGVSVTMTFVDETAGYSNVLGVFYMDINGNPVGGEIMWVDQNGLTPGDSETTHLEGVEAAEVGYFLIPDGADLNSGLANGDEVTFQQDINGNWQAFTESGTPLTGQGANVFFSGDGSLNPDGFDHTTETGVIIGFEDLVNGGDRDFEDPRFTEATFETTAEAAVYEEELGAEVGALSVTDPDAGDTHTFTVSDDRFEVVSTGSGYVLKLKDDQALDYEAETQVTVDVTVEDSGGLTDVETITIDVIDVNENTGPVGPVTDEDPVDNMVPENSGGGTVVGVTAFATDPDAADSVIYSMDDPRFEIDPISGVITVVDGAVVDHEATPFIDVDVTATSSDGSTSTETFRITVGDENEFGIGPVTDEDDTANFVQENSAGGTVVGVTALATDPDATDTVTYSITDDRFEIDENTGVIIVADGAVIDRETTEFIDIEVTATSSDGTSNTGTFRVDIGDEDDSDITDVVDTDLTNNSVTENGAGGEYVGIKAFADDPDATDTVTYSTDDPRFDIDPDTGVLTVKTGVSFDFEATPTTDVDITATSTDGSSSTGTFTVNILDVNEAPDLVFHTDTGPGVGTTLTFTSEGAGYSNSFGVFHMDDAGNPVAGQIVWTNGNKLTAGDTASVWLEGVDSANIGYFLIPDGADYNPDMNEGDMITFEKDSDGNWQAIGPDGSPLEGKGANVYFSGDESLNPDGVDHTAESGISIGFEDLPNGGDKDYDDFVFEATASNHEYRTTIVEEVDGAEAAPLSVYDPDAGDTQTFTVSDDRFEVVVSGDKYVLKLKDDQALDYETETQVTVQVTATDSGGLSDTETIVIDVIDVNESAAPVGPVSDTNDTDNKVQENSAGGTVVGVTAFALDPDSFDTVTYSITDDRFEIDPDTGVITVADGAVIDREETPHIDIDVKATSTDGSVSIGSFRIAIGDENEFKIGPVTDTDDTANAVSETATGGEIAGITAFAEDKDATDTVGYELSGDDRFEIDPDTGVITVADGAKFDAETEASIDLTVKATSTDGSSSTKEFAVEVIDGNEAPDLIVHLENGSQQFVVNGSFEVFDGKFGGSDGTGWYQNPDSIEGWTYTDVDVHQAGHNNYGATDGDHHLDLAARSNGWASQQIEGQLDGQVYELAFDMKSRGGEGQSVAEVYWNGELIDTIDPATTGSGWQTFTFNIVGGSGDGSNTLTFVEIGSDNNGGALIDSVSIVSDNRIAVVEEYFGAEIAPLSVIDPDVGDTHTFSISDDRFEVVVSDGKYLLKLKDDAALDYETETQVTLQVTATDEGGLSDTETIVIDVIDIDDTNTQIGPLSDSNDTPNMVVENSGAGTVVGLTAFADDPDVGDSVTYTITDARFEIDPDSGVVTVADGATIDHETTQFIDLEVTATSSDGSNVTESFRIKVGDDENEFDIGPIRDVDTSLNSVAENGVGGEIVGITALAEDRDLGDTVLYSTDDPRFDIDPNSGVLTVKDGVSFDYEATQMVGVEITATSSDGSSNTRTFQVEITDVNEAPDLDFDPELGPGVSVTMTFVEEGAGYSNVLGVFYMDGNGNPVGGEIVWVDQNLLNAGDTETVYLEGVEAAEVGYFLIPDGADVNDGLTSGDTVTFEKDGDGNWQAIAADGTKLQGLGANAFFSGDGSLNPDGFDHTTESGVTIGFEDLVDGGDKDFDDPVFDQTVFETNATASVYEEELGAEIGELSVTDPDAGDSHTFTVSDDRFEVVAQGANYVLKLKDDQSFDYETETQVSVDVTATDSGGLSDSETIVINVIDVEPEDGNSQVGPVKDTDTAKNLVAASVAAGAVVGLTAFAQDADTGDAVTYVIDDSRFDIGEDTGVVTVASGATLTPGEIINVTITATSSDGTMSHADFPIEVANGESDNAAPDLIVGEAIYVPVKHGGGHDDDHHDDHHGHYDDGDRGRHDHDDDDDDDDDHEGHRYHANDDDDHGHRHGHDDDDDDGGNGYYVPENEAGLELVELSVVDPDAGDTHTFTVSDDRFEVEANGDAYVLKLKDDAAVDYESEQSISLDVTAIDSSGLSDTESITLDVVDTSDDSVRNKGTGQDEILVGGDGNDKLWGKGGDDILLGQDGNDKIAGGSGDDILNGGGGDDLLNGGGGSDVFAYMLGDGNDTISGGASGSWIDIIDLSNAADGTELGAYGTDWSTTMTEGSIESVNALDGEIALSQDAGGYIELADGAQVEFSEIEGIQY